MRGRLAALGLGLVLCRCAPPPAMAPAGLAPAASGQATAGAGPMPALANSDTGTMPALGSSVTEQVRFLRRDLALPAGHWLVVAEDKAVAPGLPPLARLVLLRLLGGKFYAVLEIAGSALGHGAARGWPANPICLAGLKRGRDAQILAASHETFQPHGDQDCLTLVFLPGPSWTDPKNGLAETAKLLTTAGVALPATTIGLSLGEDDARHRLIERVWLNPDLTGIVPDTTVDPTRSAWRARHVWHDRARRQYLNRVMDFAAAWRRMVRASLDQAGMPQRPMPPLP